jgi:hypothetical protein
MAVCASTDSKTQCFFETRVFAVRRKSDERVSRPPTWLYSKTPWILRGGANLDTGHGKILFGF